MKNKTKDKDDEVRENVMLYKRREGQSTVNVRGEL
jgi:hypothetical protein